MPNNEARMFGEECQRMKGFGLQMLSDNGLGRAGRIWEWARAFNIAARGRVR